MRHIHKAQHELASLFGLVGGVYLALVAYVVDDRQRWAPESDRECNISQYGVALGVSSVVEGGMNQCRTNGSRGLPIGRASCG